MTFFLGKWWICIFLKKCRNLNFFKKRIRSICPKMIQLYSLSKVIRKKGIWSTYLVHKNTKGQNVWTHNTNMDILQTALVMFDKQNMIQNRPDVFDYKAMVMFHPEETNKINILIIVNDVLIFLPHMNMNLLYRYSILTCHWDNTRSLKSAIAGKYYIWKKFNCVCWSKSRYNIYYTLQASNLHDFRRRQGRDTVRSNGNKPYGQRDEDYYGLWGNR